MATPLAQTLAAELDRIAATYETQFAGQSRTTRSLDDLDTLVARSRELVARIDSIPEAVRPPEVQKLRTAAQETLDLYKAERERIVQAKNAPPELERFAPLAASANLVFARYLRHFAGQPRSTRDLGLLGELVAELETVQGEMKRIAKKSQIKEIVQDLELVESNAGMYKKERAHILQARLEGTPDEQGSVLAEIANLQFRAYQTHFAGRSRGTRRPALLVRMIDQLKDIQQRMKHLQKSGGLSTDANEKNIEVVRGQLEMFETELAEIRKVRKETSLGDLMGMLGGAANEVFADYRKDFDGKDRKTRDLQALSDLCDRLGELRRQMLDLQRTGPNASNDQNLEIVTEQLSAFEREWDLIRQAQPANETGAAAAKA